ncbi:MAG: hypothetical protein ABI624_19995, partial [Casimicrobiaceae bacterium]
MRDQRGLSMFVVLLVVIALVAGVVLAIPWYQQRQQENMEADAMRGVAPKHRSAAREAADKVEAREAAGSESGTPQAISNDPTTPALKLPGDNAAEEKAEPDAGAAETRQSVCAQQQEEAALYRQIVARTLQENYREKPGVIDEDRKSRRDSLEQNQRRLA